MKSNLGKGGLLLIGGEKREKREKRGKEGVKGLYFRGGKGDISRRSGIPQ